VRIDRRAQFPDLTSERRLWKIALCLRRRVEPFFLGQYKAYDVVSFRLAWKGSRIRAPMPRLLLDDAAAFTSRVWLVGKLDKGGSGTATKPCLRVARHSTRIGKTLR
jgi:hypothetical protein